MREFSPENPSCCAPNRVSCTRARRSSEEVERRSRSGTACAPTAALPAGANSFRACVRSCSSLLMGVVLGSVAFPHAYLSHFLIILLFAADEKGGNEHLTYLQEGFNELG